MLRALGLFLLVTGNYAGICAEAFAAGATYAHQSVAGGLISYGSDYVDQFRRAAG